MDFIYSFFNQPAIIIGLLTFIGLTVLKSPIEKIITGTLKTIVGFVILSLGGGIISGALNNLSPAFQNAFNIVGIIPSNEATIGIVQDSLGSEIAFIMAFGFVINILIARFTRLKYIFLSGHMVLFMAGLIATVLNHLNYSGMELILLGAFFLGATMSISPAVVQPFYKKVTGGNAVAMGHYNALAYSVSSIFSKKFGDTSKSTENIKMPQKLNFFRDNTITTGIIMLVIYLVTYVFADASVISELSNGDNIVIFAIMQAMTFTAGFVIVLQGVRIMLGEIVPAFKGISAKIVPDAIPALDVPVVFSYAPNAVLFGFISSLIGGVIMFVILTFTDLPIIIPPLIQLFFVGAGSGVLNNAVGGVRGTFIGGILNGFLIVLMPALLLPMMGQLGLTTTFGDVDFATVGILLGSIGNLLGKSGIYLLVAVLLGFFILSSIKNIKKGSNVYDKDTSGV